MRVVREFEVYQADERDNLRAIRRHRARRATWRHMIRVRRARGFIVGAFALVASVLCVAVDPRHDATFAVVAVPVAIAAIRNGI